MNIQTGVRGLLVSLIAVGLTACGEKVDCNSSAVKEDALEIIQSHLNDAAWYNEMKLAITDAPELENIKTVETDKEGKQAECSGTYSVTYNEKSRPIDVTYYLAYLEDKGDTEVKVAVGDVKAALMGLAMYERPIKNGEEKVYDIHNNKLVAVRRWKKNKEDGAQEFYSRDTGALIRQYNAVNGIKEGPEKAWSGDGTLIADLVWKDGKASGFAPTDTNDNLVPYLGSQYMITQYQDGLKSGPRKTYSRSRDGEYLTKVENFKGGKLDGLTQQFNKQGEIVFEVLYHQDSLVLDDAVTVRNLGACMDGWVENFRKTTYERGERLAEHIEYNRPQWESQCMKGMLPPLR